MRLNSLRYNRQTKLELSMASMIDVVFLLLIFFLVTTTFAKAEKHLRPAIKVDEEQSRSAQTDIEPAIVDVIDLGDRQVYRVGRNESQDPADIVSVLEQFEDKSRGAFVRVDDRVPFEMAAAAINACKQAGFQLVTYVPLDPQ